MNSYVVYGVGKRGCSLCKLASNVSNIELHLFDSCKDKQDKKVEGYIVDSIDNISDYNDELFCITVADDAMKRAIRDDMINKYGYKAENELVYEDFLLSLICMGIEDKTYDLDLKKENNIVFSSWNGLGLGGIEAWLESLLFELNLNYNSKLYVITSKGCYLYPSELQNIYDESLYNKKSATYIDICTRICKYLYSVMPCIVITDQLNYVFKVACEIKKIYPDKIKVISVCHGGIRDNIIEYAKYNQWIDQYVGVSVDIVEMFQEEGISSEKISNMCIPFKCDEKLSRNYSEDYSLPIKIGYAGRVTVPQKRIDLLMKLIGYLDEHNVDYIMNIAGDGDALPDIKELLYSMRLENKVHLYGKIDREEIPSFWKEQDICINLSDFEGRSISITEAMGNGAVPIVTSTSGVKEDIESGINGYIVPIGDYRMMGDKIVFLSKHRELLRNMGTRSHDVIYPKSRMEQHIDFWVSLLNEWQSK